eukprot:RCo033055
MYSGTSVSLSPSGQPVGNAPSGVYRDASPVASTSPSLHQSANVSPSYRTSSAGYVLSAGAYQRSNPREGSSVSRGVSGSPTFVRAASPPHLPGASPVVYRVSEAAPASAYVSLVPSPVVRSVGASPSALSSRSTVVVARPEAVAVSSGPLPPPSGLKNWSHTISVQRWPVPLSQLEIQKDWRKRGFTCGALRSPAGEATRPSRSAVNVLVAVAEGTLDVEFGETKFTLRAGDEATVPKMAEYTLTAGPSGCVWLSGYDVVKPEDPYATAIRVRYPLEKKIVRAA